MAGNMSSNSSSSSLISITVKCDLAQDEILGRVHLRVAVDRSLDSVLDEFCRLKRVRRLATFALRNDLHSELPLSLTVAAAGLSDGDIIYAFNTDPPPPPPEPTLAKDSASNWWILSGAALIIGLFGASAVVVIYVLAYQPIDAYGIVIDAGSSSSRVYVYTWPASKTDGNGVVAQAALANKSTEPIESVHGVDQLEAALRSVNWVVPDDRKAKSELFLGATAGMRLFERLNRSASEAVLDKARQRLSNNFGYKIDNATGQIRIISGAEEGLAAWITVNYLKNSFGDFAAASFASTTATGGVRRLAPDRDTFGSLDLGGASTQIAFVPPPAASASAATNNNSSSQHAVSLRLYGRTYGVYAYSFLCYGKAEAEHRMLAAVIAAAGYNTTAPIDCPCWQSGYSEVVPAGQVFQRPCSDDWHLPRPPPTSNFTVRGTGNYEACSSLVATFFNTSCRHAPTSCSFNNVSQPAPTGRFVAFSGFYYVADFFNATATASVGRSTFVEAVRRFCGQPYGTGRSSSSFLRWYCFDGIYALTLLAGYGFNDSNWARLQFADSITVNHTRSGGLQATSTSNKVGWSLGYMIQQSGLIPSEAPLLSLSLPLFVILLVMFAAFLAFSVLFACLARRAKRARGYISI